jgi:Flp pilus assembly protein TadB
MDINEVTKSGKEYVGYDYKTITTDSEKASMYIDAYESFGWLPDESMPTRQSMATVTLKLKRDRKILNKAELTRLQQHFEACMDEIATLETTKTRTATIYSLAVGLIGTAFLAGSVFAVTHEPPMILLCVVLGIPGLIGWALPYQIYKFFLKKRTIEVTPLIEQKYDEIHEICEKGSSLRY